MNVRLSAEDADTIRLRAEAQQMTLSEYVRRAALGMLA
jgi:predicted HicB family RNase H-like nuclease